MFTVVATAVFIFNTEDYPEIDSQAAAEAHVRDYLNTGPSSSEFSIQVTED